MTVRRNLGVESRKFKYGLTYDQVYFVEDILSNDENSTDDELVEYFIGNGLTANQAEVVLNHRDDYLLNIYLTGHGPLNT